MCHDFNVRTCQILAAFKPHCPRKKTSRFVIAGIIMDKTIHSVRAPLGAIMFCNKLDCIAKNYNIIYNIRTIMHTKERTRDTAGLCWDNEGILSN
jgi:hypothetical protein